MSIVSIVDETTANYPTSVTDPTALAADPVLHIVEDLLKPSLGGDDIRHLVALHVAATILPVTAPLTTREEVRARWFTALQAITQVSGHPDWAMAYLPGLHPCDADAYAVHLPTERVFGGCTNTSIQRGESTHHWLDRLSTLLPQN